MDPLTRKGLECDGWAADSADTRLWTKPEATACVLPGAAERDDASRERLAWLVSTIEAEIIPRLMLAHRSPERVWQPTGVRSAPGVEEVEAFAGLVLGSSADAARAHVDAMRDDGVALEVIYLQLLAPAARHLGTLWTDDRIDFSAVTAALWRLQQMMYDLSPAFQGEADANAAPRRALLAPAPGSQHTFGLLMVAEFFQRAGWQVWTEPAVSLPVLVEEVRSSRFDVIGLSAGSVCHLDAVSGALVALRAASLNPRVAIMVGGPLFNGRPDLAAQVGADASADDAGEAVAQAQRLVERGGARRACG